MSIENLSTQVKLSVTESNFETVISGDWVQRTAQFLLLKTRITVDYNSLQDTSTSPLLDVSVRRPWSETDILKIDVQILYPALSISRTIMWSNFSGYFTVTSNFDIISTQVNIQNYMHSTRVGNMLDTAEGAAHDPSFLRRADNSHNMSDDHLARLRFIWKSAGFRRCSEIYVLLRFSPFRKEVTINCPALIYLAWKFLCFWDTRQDHRGSSGKQIVVSVGSVGQRWLASL